MLAYLCEPISHFSLQSCFYTKNSLRNKHAPSRQREYTATRLRYPMFYLCFYTHPALTTSFFVTAVHKFRSFSFSNSTSRCFCKIFTPTLLQIRPVVTYCQISDVGLPILTSRTALTLQRLQCAIQRTSQHFPPIVY
jgi:hypothetical protein